jgi:hypothetical protein
MLTIVLVVGLVAVALFGGLLVFRSRSGRNGSSALPSLDPHTHARDNTDPARAVDQLRSQGNAGGGGGVI